MVLRNELVSENYTTLKRKALVLLLAEEMMKLPGKQATLHLNLLKTDQTLDFLCKGYCKRK